MEHEFFIEYSPDLRQQEILYVNYKNNTAFGHVFETPEKLVPWVNECLQGKAKKYVSAKS